MDSVVRRLGSLLDDVKSEGVEELEKLDLLQRREFVKDSVCDFPGI